MNSHIASLAPGNATAVVRHFNITTGVVLRLVIVA